MILPPFDLLEPTSVEQACALLDEHGDAARLLASGTDVLVNMKKRTLFDVHPPARAGERFAGRGHPWAGPRAASVLVSLGRIPDLVGVTTDEDGRAVVGPMTVMSDLAAHPTIRRHYTALAEGAAAVGAPTIRNRATYGGNLCHARPAADTAPASMVLGAELHVRSSDGERVVPADELMVAPGVSSLRPGEVVRAIVLPAPRLHHGSAYAKLINRATLEISIVGVAAALTLDGRDGRCVEARVAMGAVGPTPLRAPSAEAALAGRAVTPEVIAAAAAAAVGDASPIDDHRGSAAYRREMVQVLTRRALQAAHERATGASARTAATGGDHA